MAKLPTFSVEELRELLSYDPETGEFRWKVRRGCAQIGQSTGCLNAMGYQVIRIHKALWYAHRLAWFYVHGEWPSQEVDHINGDPSDNRLCNLRLASHAENGRNMKKHADNRIGAKGVTWHRQNRKWDARITIAGKSRRIGLFDTPEEAAAAYDAAARKYHGEFARTNSGT